jgi:hypothetical protein
MLVLVGLLGAAARVGHPSWWDHHWRELLDVLGVAATVAAAVLAWVAIRRGNRQAEDAIRALQRERRINFYLDQLAALAEAIWVDADTDMPSYQVRQRVTLLPVGLVPTAHEWCSESEVSYMDASSRFHSSPEYDRYSGDFSYWIRDQIKAEIKEATEDLLAERMTARQGVRGASGDARVR